MGASASSRDAFARALFGIAGTTIPAGAAPRLRLSTTDPGSDGSGATEVTAANGYAPIDLTSGDLALSNPDPDTTRVTIAAQSYTATAAWEAGASIPWAYLTDENDTSRFMGRIPLTPALVVGQAMTVNLNAQTFDIQDLD